MPIVENAPMCGTNELLPGFQQAVPSKDNHDIKLRSAKIKMNLNLNNRLGTDLTIEPSNLYSVACNRINDTLIVCMAAQLVKSVYTGHET